MLALRPFTKKSAPLHFRRIELKYVMPERLIPLFIERIAPYTQPDPFLIQEGGGRRSYPVSSLYFDSVDLHSAKEKEAGLLSRRKLRLRTYEEEFSATAPAFLEIKRRHDFVVSKDRLSLSVGHLNETLPMAHLLQHVLDRVEASAEVTSEAQLLAGWFSLQPTALIRYQRMPFIGRQDRRFRITIDTDLGAAWKPRKLLGRQFTAAMHPGFCIIELKCDHGIPAWFHDVLRDFEMSRIAHSKYALGVEMLRARMEIPL